MGSQGLRTGRKVVTGTRSPGWVVLGGVVAVSTVVGLVACTDEGSTEDEQGPGREAPQIAEEFRGDGRTGDTVPVPSSEESLQTVGAEEWFSVSDEGESLEGASFDQEGNLFFCDVTGQRVMRVTPDGEETTVAEIDDLAPGATALSEDGRLFIAALDIPGGRGAIMSMNPDGSDIRTEIDAEEGYMPNDLVFGENGGFYFSDFRGSSTSADGGIYYVSPDGQESTAVISDLAMANGVALSPGGDVLWATEFGRNFLHRVQLSDPITPDPLGSSVPYHFTGPAPDSMRVDSDGNTYVALYGQGRVMAFNANGIPIGQVLLPGREDGHNLLTTSLAVHPESNEMYIVAADEGGEDGAAVYRAPAFAAGLEPAW